MRLIAISRVVDEADIVEAFIRHSAAFVDHHILLDNGSQDGTLDILASLRKEGIPLTVYQNRCVSFNEANHLTDMYRIAVSAHAADWVACLDVDEFIDQRLSPAGLDGLLENLMQADPPVIAIKLPLIDYIATRNDVVSELIVPVRLRRRRPTTENFKVIARGGFANIDLEILPGAHDVMDRRNNTRVEAQTQISLAHYSERSAWQYVVKFVRGWNKVIAASPDIAANGHAVHYKVPYETLRDTPERLLRNDHFMGFKNEVPGLIDDPIDYVGGALRYTSEGDVAMRAVRSLMGTMQDLARRHSALLETFPAVKHRVTEWDSEHVKLF